MITVHLLSGKQIDIRMNMESFHAELRISTSDGMWIQAKGKIGQDVMINPAGVSHATADIEDED